MPEFDKLTLEAVLSTVMEAAYSYTWSVQVIDAVGDVESVIGMSMLELEKICDKSDIGWVTDIETLIAFAESCEDIVDIVVIGCKDTLDIPKAYTNDGWENSCDIVISREDSSLWMLGAKEDETIDRFMMLNEYAVFSSENV